MRIYAMIQSKSERAAGKPGKIFASAGRRGADGGRAPRRAGAVVGRHREVAALVELRRREAGPVAVDLAAAAPARPSPTSHCRGRDRCRHCRSRARCGRIRRPRSTTVSSQSWPSPCRQRGQTLAERACSRSASWPLSLPWRTWVSQPPRLTKARRMLRSLRRSAGRAVRRRPESRWAAARRYRPSSARRLPCRRPARCARRGPGDRPRSARVVAGIEPVEGAGDLRPVDRHRLPRPWRRAADWRPRPAP